MELKKCNKCKKYKPATADEFYRDRSKKDRLHTVCKICSDRAKQKYCIINKEKIRLRKKAYAIKNKERISRRNKKIHAENKERDNKRMREYQKKNPHIFRKSRAKYRATLKGRLNHRISNSMRKGIKNQRLACSWQKQLNYTLNDLIKHLKKTIPKGYNWNDYLKGELHIDHKIPINAFNYSKMTHLDFKRCWALSNLQLLPAKENISKGARLKQPFQPSLEF